ncbi:fimbrial protein [Enterobacter bugandensis]|uniref:fimbrial protein n=1 Tax=Enterobacter bugandensis TaxID=881260 RepID=UPI002FCE78C8
MKKIYAYIWSVISLMIISQGANAACYVNQGGPKTYTLTQSALTVQRDAPVGTVIGTIVATGPSGAYLSCSGSGHGYYAVSKFNTPSSIGSVYNTNIPGVGVKVQLSNSSLYFENPALVRNYANATVYIDGYLPQVSFIKTGNVISGIVSSGTVGVTTDDGGVAALTVNLSGNSITQLACSITTPNLTFSIGNILASSFGASVGTIPPGAQNTQNLGLNCDAGANINVSLQGTQNPDVSTTSVLALSGQGNADVAKGVGVQFLYNGAPLVLNNRIVLKRSAGGQETFPITARYYQTKTAVTTGKANASATLDITYQ